MSNIKIDKIEVSLKKYFQKKEFYNQILKKYNSEIIKEICSLIDYNKDIIEILKGYFKFRRKIAIKYEFKNLTQLEK